MMSCHPRLLVRCTSPMKIPLYFSHFQQQQYQSLRNCHKIESCSTTATNNNESVKRVIMVLKNGKMRDCSAATFASSWSSIHFSHRGMATFKESLYPYYGPCSWRDQQRRNNSSTSGDEEISGIRGGADLLSSESPSLVGTYRKIILEAYAPSGIDVNGLICVGGKNNYIDEAIKNESEELGDLPGMSKIIHMNGSILAFPTMCFLWNIKHPHEVTLESLAPVRLYSPSIQYLFLGCDLPFPSGTISNIKKEMKIRHDIVVESMDVMNAMGTFNILNGEDRQVACAIVLNVDE